MIRALALLLLVATPLGARAQPFWTSPPKEIDDAGLGRWLAARPDLHSLDLSAKPNLTDACIDHVVKLRHVEWLCLHLTATFGTRALERLDEIGRLSTLQLHDSERRAIGDKDLRAIARARQIRSLRLSMGSGPRRAMTAEGFAALAPMKLEHLRLSQVDDRLASGLARAGVRALDCGKWPISARSLVALRANRALRVLGLHDAETLDDDMVETLATLTQLTGLELGNSKVSRAGLKALVRDLTGLEHLGLAHNPLLVDADFAVLAKARLRSIEVRSAPFLDRLTSGCLAHLTKVRGVEDGKAVGLRRLVLSDGNIALPIDRIVALTDLRALDIGEAGIVTDAALTKLATLKQLRELRLSFSRVVTRDGLNALRALPIETLDMCWSRIDDLRPLAALPLRWLKVGGDHVTDDSAAQLAGFGRLETLILYQHRMSDGALKRLRAKLPKTRIFALRKPKRR